MKPIFVQLQCEPGKTYDVADAIYKTELVSELYSTSGEYDLLLKVYLPQEEDIGKFINLLTEVCCISNIHSLTTCARCLHDLPNLGMQIRKFLQVLWLKVVTPNYSHFMLNFLSVHFLRSNISNQ